MKLATSHMESLPRPTWKPSSRRRQFVYQNSKIEPMKNFLSMATRVVRVIYMCAHSDIIRSILTWIENTRRRCVFSFSGAIVRLYSAALFQNNAGIRNRFFIPRRFPEKKDAEGKFGGYGNVARFSSTWATLLIMVDCLTLCNTSCITCIWCLLLSFWYVNQIQLYTTIERIVVILI